MKWIGIQICYFLVSDMEQVELFERETSLFSQRENGHNMLVFRLQVKTIVLYTFPQGKCVHKKA